MLLKIQNQILEFLQRRCAHRSEWVSIDILEGDAEGCGIAVSQCNRCGAVRIFRKGPISLEGVLPTGAWAPIWREPRATWTERIIF